MSKNIALSLCVPSGWEDECGGSKQSRAADSPQYLGGRAGGPGCGHTCPQGELDTDTHKSPPLVPRVTHIAGHLTYIYEHTDIIITENNTIAFPATHYIKYSLMFAFTGDIHGLNLTCFSITLPKRMWSNREGMCKQERKEAELVKTMAQESFWFPSPFILLEHH